jgi:hemolysin activation/secretion protein
VNRYEVDGRAFLPLSPTTRLGLRLRGGYATSEAPLQTQFTLGGIGSVRSYDQNARRGTCLLLGNVEYIIDGATLDSDVLDDLFLVGLFDAGWVEQPGQRFRMDDVLPSAGFGIGLDERQIRLDVAWPLRDVPATGSRPSIWLRITPNF